MLRCAIHLPTRRGGRILATFVKICKCTYSLNSVRNVKLYKLFAVCKCIGSDAGNALLDPDLCYLVTVSVPGDFFLILPFMAPWPFLP